jgi:hypothetical protein
LTLYEELRELLDQSATDGLTVEQQLESVGIYDHEGIRQFARDYTMSIAMGKPMEIQDVGASLVGGFFMGLAYAKRHPELAGEEAT